MFHFITHEIGSLAKPEWRVKAALGKPILKKDIDEAVFWGDRLALDYQPLITLLKKEKPSKQKILEWSSLYGVKLLERAGLDVVYDGEQQRSEMYQYPVSHSSGFVFRGHVRSFDNKYYQKAACVSLPKVKKPWYTAEYLNLLKIAKRKIKIPITGAYTIVAWSFDEFYARQAEVLGSKHALQSQKEKRRNFILDIARNLIRPNIKMLLEKGAKWIQIDEPAATTIPSEVPLFVESFNESVKGLTGEFSVHICFSDYTLLFPHITKMENCSEYALELANRDSHNLGLDENYRSGYEILKLFKKYKVPSRIGLGVSDIHSNFIEPAELVRDRILYAVSILKDPRKINPTPDCGLRTRSWEVAYRKLISVVDGARLVEQMI